MKNKILTQILKPIAAPKFAEQRNHIYSQFKKMLAKGMSRETALVHAQFSVDSLTGNYTNGETIVSVRECNGRIEVRTVCCPPLGIATQDTRKSIYVRYPNTYFSDEKVFKAA